jgi:glycosyltransferase involved in cell wall biosynthesis
MRPRVLFVARARYTLPLRSSLERKWSAVGRAVDFRVVASSVDRSTGDETFRLRRRTPLDGPRFWLSLPWRLRREVRRFRPDAIVAQSPYEAAAALAARTDVPVIVELHGDWRTFARLYGSPSRRRLARIADAIGDRAVRKAAKVRAVSPYTAGLARAAGREPDAEFPAFMDLAPFTAPELPLPEQPVVLFIGVLEPYKNIDGLAEAWRLARDRIPHATLRLVGDGTRADLARALVQEGRVSWDRRLDTDEVVRALDEASLLVLPSRSEGMGRVVIEAHLRGRPVLGSAVGGIPDLVHDGVDGVLVPPEPQAIAAALAELIGDPERLLRLAGAARAAGEAWLVSPDEYAASVRELVER